mmetsp:Transcript_21649/g.30334  ORF Transcript_21649/g.30334 Transcript_21649/m.30334 type:complete len:249 (+) Transcript_21649:90-836(+)
MWSKSGTSRTSQIYNGSEDKIFSVQSPPISLCERDYISYLLSASIIFVLCRIYIHSVYFKQWDIQLDLIEIPSISAIIGLLFMLLFTILYFEKEHCRMLVKQHVCTAEVTPVGVVICDYTVTYRDKETNKKNNNYSIWQTSLRDSPLGIQKEKSRNVQVISREDIIDVIISEMVLSYKVINCVMFRVQNRAEMNIGKNSNASQICEAMMDLNVSSIKLIPAFSPDHVAMTYVECEKMWLGLMKALNKI